MSDRRRMPRTIDTGSLTEMGLMKQTSTRADRLSSRSWQVEVYLNDCSITGLLEGTHNRLSDYLRAVTDLITLTDCTVRSVRSGKELLRKPQAIVTVPNILFVVDCTSVSPETSAGDFARIEKRLEGSVLNVGPFWIAGQLHLPPEGNLHSYLSSGTGALIPATGIRISGHDQHNGRTALINRDHLRCILS